MDKSVEDALDRSALAQCLEALGSCDQGEPLEFWKSRTASDLATSDAKACGPHIVHLLSSILGKSGMSESHGPKTCSLLVSLASEAIATYPYADVPPHWRRLHMDASLLQVIMTLKPEEFEQEDIGRVDLIKLVKVLDMANIVTGYLQDGRNEVFFSLMKQVQKRLSALPDSERRRDNVPTRPTKRVRLQQIETTSSPQALPGIALIPTYLSMEAAPDMASLSSQSTPFVVRNAVSDWPALSDPSTSWKNEQYLMKVAGQGRIVPVEIGSSYTSEGWTQKMMDFGDFLSKIEWTPSERHRATQAQDVQEPTLYLAQHDLFQQFPSLLNDIFLPDYIWSAPEAPAHFKEYKPPNNPDGYTINAWMGPKGTYSPAHTDPYFNCYGKLDFDHGTKRSSGLSIVVAQRSIQPRSSEKSIFGWLLRDVQLH